MEIDYDFNLYEIKQIEQNKEKINGILSTFDRMIVNGYLLPLQNPRLFLYYLIQNDIKLKDFDKFAESQTSMLCNHIDKYVEDNNVKAQYLRDISTNKDELARKEWQNTPNKYGLIASFSVVELCRTMTVSPNRSKTIRGIK